MRGNWSDYWPCRKVLSSRAWQKVAILAIVLTAPFLARAETLGYVLEIEGQWLLRGQSAQLLSVGQQVPPGAVVEAVQPSQFSRITVVDREYKIIAQRSCEQLAQCAVPLAVPATFETNQRTRATLFDRAMELLREKPDFPSVHISRGDDWADAAAVLAGGKLQIGGVLAAAPPGVYLMRVKTVLGNPIPASLEHPSPVRWDGSAASLMEVGDLSPGLYELARMSRDGNRYRSTGVSAWVLAVRPGQYEEMTRLLSEVQALAESWGNRVAPATVTAFRRVYMARLAELLRN